MTIRLLIIGRPSANWTERLRATVAPSVEIDAARLPSAGIRQFEQTPADFIIIADDQGGPRVETLAQAIRQRPLGSLVPLLLLCPLPKESAVDDRINALDLVDWLPLDTSPDTLVRTIEASLDTSLSDLADVDKASSAAGESTSYFGGDVLLEPIDDEPQPQPIDRSSIFRSPVPSFSEGVLSADEIRRKLKAVRHEDYYAILEVRRGAESQSVREAFHRLYARFDPRTVDFELLHRFQDEVDEIRDALEDAFAVLGDPDLRQPYLRHTVKP